MSIAFNGTNGITFFDGSIQSYAQSAVRQTVVNGPVDTNGQSAFGGSTGAATVTASGTLYVTAANGVTNRNSLALINPSWSGLTTTGTMYLYVTVNIDGSCTTGSTTLLPVYQFGGTPATTSGQYTYNIQQMQMQVGNGSTASQSYTVFVGEVTVASGITSAIIWYALMGRNYGTQLSLSLATAYSFNQNIGVKPFKVFVWLECTTADAPYVVGDRVGISFNGNFGSGGTQYGVVYRNTRNVFILNTLSSGISEFPGQAAALSTANWSAGWFLERGF